MEHHAFFSSQDKSKKKMKRSSAAILHGSLRVKGQDRLLIFSYTHQAVKYSWCFISISEFFGFFVDEKCYYTSCDHLQK